MTAIAEVWGLRRLAFTVGLVAVAVVGIGDDDTWHVPLVSLPVDVFQIAAALSGALLGWVLVDRCPELSLRSPRVVAVHDLLRYFLLATGAGAVPLVVLVAGTPDPVTGSAFLWLAALSACLVPVVGELVWAPALLVGYLWLQVHTEHPELLGWTEGRTVAIAVLVGGAAYVGGSALRRRRALVASLV